MVTKPTREPHYERTRPSLTFADALRQLVPGTVYRTTRSHTPFIATVQTATRGTHAGQPVIVFRSKDGRERARVYKCCWNHRTNCNRTYVDCYVLAL